MPAKRCPNCKKFVGAKQVDCNNCGASLTVDTKPIGSEKPKFELRMPT